MVFMNKVVYAQDRGFVLPRPLLHPAQARQPPMKQSSFSDMAYDQKKKTRKERFLGEMDAVLPWDILLAPIEAHYPKRGGASGGCIARLAGTSGSTARIGRSTRRAIA